MNIGVVCEGPTDFPVFTSFFSQALLERGVQASFRALFPEIDQTRPEGGWANVLLWLKNHPPEFRIQQYFGGGLFAGALSAEPLDAIVLQLDTDVIDDGSFRKFVKSEYSYDVVDADTPHERSARISDILALASEFSAMTAIDVQRHVIAPAAESTETWCVAAFHNQPSDFEALKGLDLVNAFMTALERSEGRDPDNQYASIDKNFRRRQRFCERHAAGANRIVASCEQFSLAVDRLIAL